MSVMSLTNITLGVKELQKVMTASRDLLLSDDEGSRKALFLTGLPGQTPEIGIVYSQEGKTDRCSYPDSFMVLLQLPLSSGKSGKDHFHVKIGSGGIAQLYKVLSDLQTAYPDKKTVMVVAEGDKLHFVVGERDSKVVDLVHPYSLNCAYELRNTRENGKYALSLSPVVRNEKGDAVASLSKGRFAYFPSPSPTNKDIGVICSELFGASVTKVKESDEMDTPETAPPPPPPPPAPESKEEKEIVKPAEDKPSCLACGDTGKNSKGGPCICQKNKTKVEEIKTEETGSPAPEPAPAPASEPAPADEPADESEDEKNKVRKRRRRRSPEEIEKETVDKALAVLRERGYTISKSDEPESVAEKLSSVIVALGNGIETLTKVKEEIKTMPAVDEEAVKLLDELRAKLSK